MRLQLQTLAGLAIVGTLLVLAGCGGDGMHYSRGQVTLDGEPLADGTIEFLPPDGQGPTAGAVISDGQYELRVAPGTKQVVIQAFRTVGEEPAMPGDPESPLVPIRQEVALAEYGRDSPQEVTIPMAGDLDFELTSR